MIDPALVGRAYGPYRYLVGAEEMRDFAAVLAGGAPGRAFAREAPAALTVPAEDLVPPPTYCVRFAIEPFARACRDEALGLDLSRLLHGEQSLELLEAIRPGDAIATRGEVVGVWQKAGMEFFTVKTTSVNQRGELVVLGLWTAVVLPAR